MHTQVAFTVNHFGFSNYVGLFGMANGSLTIDPAQPAKARVYIEIPMNEVRTSSTELDQHLKGNDVLDNKQYPNAKFDSTAGKVVGTPAKIPGTMTMPDVPKPPNTDAQLTHHGEGG